MKNTISALEAKINKLKGVCEERERTQLSLVSSKDELELSIPILKDSISLAKKCLEESLEQRKYIEEIVSSGLSEVFGVDHQFVLEPVYGVDGSLKGLKPRLKEAGGEFDDPLTSFGAGAQSIASICFKISILLLSTGTAKVLIMDEPLANVNTSLQDRFKAFIENISKETGLQIIMITHMDQPFGKVFSVEKEKKKSKRISKVKEVIDYETLEV